MELESEYEAWRTGFELAAAACVSTEDKKKTAEEFATEVAEGLHNDLLLMLNFGRHEHNGIWHIVGLRMAIYMIILTDWEPVLRTDQEAMSDLWNNVENQSPELIASITAEELSQQLMLPIVMIDSDASRFISNYLM